jgi:hypothetical protein
MHDPMTQAFQINYPWRKYGKKGRDDWQRNYREPFITVWHVDPEADGSDDSCGWSRPRLSKDQQARISSIAGDEAREPWFQQYRGKQIDSPTEAETLLRQVFMLVGKVFSKQHLCKPAIKPVTYAEASQWACEMLANPVDNFRSSLSFLPGWSSNFPEDREQDRKYTAERLFWCIGAFILRERRPWYRHPRWHIWHWDLQIHPLEHFKRWAFSRCADCGGRFKWGRSGWTNSWNSEGPQWFRSEKDLHHNDCRNPASEGVASASPVNTAN